VTLFGKNWGLAGVTGLFDLKYQLFACEYAVEKLLGTCDLGNVLWVTLLRTIGDK